MGGLAVAGELLLPTSGFGGFISRALVFLAIPLVLWLTGFLHRAEFEQGLALLRRLRRGWGPHEPAGRQRGRAVRRHARAGAGGARDAARASTTSAGDELIVADNSGTAPPLDLASSSTTSAALVVVRAEGEASASHARNVGAAAAGNDWILFLDSDVVAPADLLEQLLLRADRRARGRGHR